MSTVCVKRVANTRSRWIFAGDANMEPSDFAEVFSVKEARPRVKAPPRRCVKYCAEGIGGAEIGKTVDYFVVCDSLEENRDFGGDQ